MVSVALVGFVLGAVVVANARGPFRARAAGEPADLRVIAERTRALSPVKVGSSLRFAELLMATDVTLPVDIVAPVDPPLATSPVIEASDVSRLAATATSSDDAGDTDLARADHDIDTEARMSAAQQNLFEGIAPSATPPSSSRRRSAASGYAVQILASRDLAAAEKEALSLRAQGFDAIVDEGRGATGVVVYRVRLAGLSTRLAAEQAQDRLVAATGYRGLVIAR